MRNLSSLQQEVEQVIKLREDVIYLLDMLELSEQEQDVSIIKMLSQETNNIYKEFQEYEMNTLFTGTHDRNNAIIVLHAGAGGTEAQDWCQILLRMYSQWAEDNGFKIEELDRQPGKEAGLKGITLLIKGEYAYGKMRCEVGIHRLVRISPFDAAARRHTSFVSLSVYPEINDTIEVNLNPDDLRIDTFRSTGAGGQHINTTDSAVRITHIPTGIVVSCQSERSQTQNKESAMKILMGRLYELEEQKRQEELKKITGEQKEVAWGSQIRSYTLNPFSLVKDHRTGLECGNAQGVLDGDLNDFIYAYLQWERNRR